VKSLADVPVKSVELLGADQKPVWKRDASGLAIELPTGSPNDCAFVFRIRQ
jgi:hypothetical protein